MEIIVRPHRYGKTTELIKRASQVKYGLIVCSSKNESFRIWDMISEMMKSGEITQAPPMPITYREFLDREYAGKNITEFFIDNADNLLQSITPVKIGAITLTDDYKIHNVDKYYDEVEPI